MSSFASPSASVCACLTFPDSANVRAARNRVLTLNDRDVGVAQRGQRLRFTLKARKPFGIVREAVGKHLYRNLSTQIGVECAIDLAHPAGAQQREDSVGAEPRAWLDGHSSLM